MVSENDKKKEVLILNDKHSILNQIKLSMSEKSLLLIFKAFTKVMN